MPFRHKALKNNLKIHVNHLRKLDWPDTWTDTACKGRIIRRTVSAQNFPALGFHM